jgi:hypothetical protein
VIQYLWVPIMVATMLTPIIVAVIQFIRMDR